MNIENKVIKKTNKYVYLSNGTHISHSDFHRYKQDIRKEMSIIHAKEYAESTEVIVQSLEDVQNKINLLNSLEQKQFELSQQINYIEHDWKKSFKDEENRHNETKNLLENHARILYKDLANLPLIKTFQEEKGTKFIIQNNYNDNSNRFCFDPYKLGGNGHSIISRFYNNYEGFCTVNGGWMKVIKDTVILYYKSGDYGIYDDKIAKTCAQIIFPDYEILSYAGQEWRDSMINYQ